MFKGRYNHSVDAKGRASLPARFRETIASSGNDRVVLTFALDSSFPHVDVYPYSRWTEFEERLASQPVFDDAVTQLKRLYVANAIECPLDGHGRILIPQSHRDYAGIDKDAVWVGMTRTIELWQPARWEQAEAEAMANILDVRKGLAGFNL